MQNNENLLYNIGTLRQVQLGGCTKEDLLLKLQKAGVQLNPYALRLMESDTVLVSEKPYHVETVEVSVQDLGFEQGALTEEIYARAETLGLSLCPIELAPFLRLQWLGQEEGSIGREKTMYQAPSGSVTVASESLVEDDDFPKGFYLRRIEGTLWLRGYICGADHVWKVEDHFIFVKAH